MQSIALFHFKFCVDMKNLIHLKWINDKGEKQKFELIKKVSAKWREIGFHLQFPKEKLDMWEEKFQGNAYNCWYAMISEWLEENPAKWTDLFSMLDDIGYSKVRVDLESALTSASVFHGASSVHEVHPIIPPLPPPPHIIPPTTSHTPQQLPTVTTSNTPSFSHVSKTPQLDENPSNHLPSPSTNLTRWFPPHYRHLSKECSQFFSNQFHLLQLKSQSSPVTCHLDTDDLD